MIFFLDYVKLILKINKYSFTILKKLFFEVSVPFTGKKIRNGEKYRYNIPIALVSFHYGLNNIFMVQDRCCNVCENLRNFYIELRILTTCI